MDNINQENIFEYVPPVEVRFKLCFFYVPKGLSKIKENYSELFDKYSYEYFKGILKNTKMEEYTDYLYEYLIIQKNNNESEKQKPFDVNDEKSITDALLLLINKDLKGLKLKLDNPIDKDSNVLLENTVIIEQLKESLLKIYNDWGLNLTYLSYKESEDILRCSKNNSAPESQTLSQSDINWINEYINNAEEIENFLIIEKLTVNDLWGADGKLNYFSPEMVESYSKEHPIKNQVTIQFLKEKQKQFKSKSGAKPKNDKIAQFIEKAFLLIRINDFLKACDTEIIKEVKIKKDYYVLVHDILVFFEFMEDQKLKVNYMNEYQYLKTLLKNYKGRESEYQKRSFWYNAEKTIANYKVTLFFNPFLNRG